MALTPKSDNAFNAFTDNLLLSSDEAQTPMEQVRAQAEREALDELAAGIAALDVQLESNAEILKSNAQLLESMDRNLGKARQLQAENNVLLKEIAEILGVGLEDPNNEDMAFSDSGPTPDDPSLTTLVPVNKTLTSTMHPALSKNASLTLLQWCCALLKKLWHCLQRKPKAEKTSTKAESLSLFSAERHATETPPATVTTIAAAPGA